VAENPTDTVRLPRGERRQQILAVAAEAFAVSGFNGTSLADIAARVGISQPAILHHYRTKEALILAVLEHRDRLDEEHLTAQFEGKNPTLSEYWLEVCRRNTRQPDLVQLFTVTAAESLDPDHPAHEFYRNRYQRNWSDVAERLRADQSAGHIDPTLDPDHISADLLALTNGLQLQWLMYPEIDLTARVRIFLDRLTPPSA
jgi:AcrR family transcriptional regulator